MNQNAKWHLIFRASQVNVAMRKGRESFAGHHVGERREAGEAAPQALRAKPPRRSASESEAKSKRRSEAESEGNLS
jgi:hypothetical protein